MTIKHTIYYKSGKWLIARIESDEYGSSYNTVLHIGCLENIGYATESCYSLDTIYGKSFQVDWEKAQAEKIIRCVCCGHSPRNKYFKVLVHIFEAYGRID